LSNLESRQSFDNLRFKRPQFTNLQKIRRKKRLSLFCDYIVDGQCT